MNAQHRQRNHRVAISTIDRDNPEGQVNADTHRIPRLLTLGGLGLVLAAIWVALLVTTNFNGDTVAFGLRGRHVLVQCE